MILNKWKMKKKVWNVWFVLIHWIENEHWIGALRSMCLNRLISYHSVHERICLALCTYSVYVCSYFLFVRSCLLADPETIFVVLVRKLVRFQTMRRTMWDANVLQCFLNFQQMALTLKLLTMFAGGFEFHFLLLHFFGFSSFFSHRLLFLNNSWFQLPHKNIWNNLYFCSPQFCVQCRWHHFAFILRTFECIQNLK